MAILNLTGLILNAASASVNGADLDNLSAVGGTFTVDITAISGAGAAATFTVQGKDELSGKYYTILASAALNATGTTVLRVYPGLTASANVTATSILPRTIRVICTITGSTPAVTATVGVSLND